MDEDHVSTTVIVRAIRRRVSWKALGAGFGGLVAAIAYVLNAQHNISLLNQQAAASKHAMEKVQDQLSNINTQLTTLNTKADGIATNMASLQKWRENIEQAAETPPHSRRTR